jgi:hypothetical protein
MTSELLREKGERREGEMPTPRILVKLEMVKRRNLGKGHGGPAQAIGGATTLRSHVVRGSGIIRRRTDSNNTS